MEKTAYSAMADMINDKLPKDKTEDTAMEIFKRSRKEAREYNKKTSAYTREQFNKSTNKANGDKLEQY
jgi:hypothetical protein